MISGNQHSMIPRHSGFINSPVWLQHPAPWPRLAVAPERPRPFAASVRSANLVFDQ
jgi:hypothetical protein